MRGDVKRKRVESILKEVIPEALANLDDDRLNTLIVTEVICSRGRYDAKVFLDPMGVKEEDRRDILKRLPKVSKFLQNYVKETQGWYRAPKLTFEFDTFLEDMNRMDELFKKIENKKEGEDGNREGD